MRWMRRPFHTTMVTGWCICSHWGKINLVAHFSRVWYLQSLLNLLCPINSLNKIVCLWIICTKNASVVDMCGIRILPVTLCKVQAKSYSPFHEIHHWCLIPKRWQTPVPSVNVNPPVNPYLQFSLYHFALKRLSHQVICSCPSKLSLSHDHCRDQSIRIFAKGIHCKSGWDVQRLWKKTPLCVDIKMRISWFQQDFTC